MPQRNLCCEKIAKISMIDELLWWTDFNKQKNKVLLTSNFLGETSVSAYMVAKVSSWQVVHDKVKVFSILKGVVHVDDERILELRQDLPLINDWLDAALCYYSCFTHLFHGKVLLCLFAFNSPYFAEATLADAKVINEVGFRYSYNRQTEFLR